MPSHEYNEESIIWEKTIILYTLIEPDLFEKNIGTLKKYLHTFGRETNQGEVVLEYDGQLFSIIEYNYDDK